MKSKLQSIYKIKNVYNFFFLILRSLIYFKNRCHVTKQNNCCQGFQLIVYINFSLSLLLGAQE